jgi:transcriptional regulator with XRE-family HTH domain
MRELINLMMDQESRKAFGVRLKTLRKQRKWTQKELAAKIGIYFSQLNKYELGLHLPPADKLLNLSEIFGTTVDYLLTGNESEAKPLHSVRLLDRFRELEALDSDEQETVIKLVDAFIVQHKVEGTLKSLRRVDA